MTLSVALSDLVSKLLIKHPSTKARITQNHEFRRLDDNMLLNFIASEKRLVSYSYLLAAPSADYFLPLKRPFSFIRSIEEIFKKKKIFNFYVLHDTANDQKTKQKVDSSEAALLR